MTRTTGPARTPAGRAVSYPALDGLARPCDSIEFARMRDGSAAVTLVFLPAPGYPAPREARFGFDYAAAAVFEDEMSPFHPFPANPPMTDARTVFPALRVDGSEWFRGYCDRGHADPVRHAHFAFISYDIVLHLIGDIAPAARWLD